MKNKKLLITAVSLLLIPTCFVAYKYRNASISHQAIEKNIVDTLANIEDFQDRDKIKILEVIDDTHLLSVIFKYNCYSAYAEFLKDTDGNYIYSYSEMKKSNNPITGYVQRNLTKDTPTKFIVYANCNNNSATKVRVTVNGKCQEKRIRPAKDNVVIFNIDNLKNPIFDIKTEFLNSQGDIIFCNPTEEISCC